MESDIIIFKQSSLVSLVKVKFEIKDINDNAPSFKAPYLQFDISEGSLPGTMITTVPHATDPDSPRYGVKSYKLKSDYDSLFKIEVRKNILLRLNGQLDREKVSSYSIALIASDGGVPEKHGVIIFKLTLTDVNDNIPVFMNSSRILSVPENQKIDNLFKFFTADPDEGINSQVSVAVVDSNVPSYASTFSVHPTSGVLDLIQPLDYESTPEVLLVVVARDSGKPSLSSSASFTIIVTDVNDNNPYIQVLTSSSFLPSEDLQLSSRTKIKQDLLENAPPGSIVLTLHVTDKDSGFAGECECRVDLIDYRLKDFYE